jgi:PhzF family phenazine biosynthesis protein
LVLAAAGARRYASGMRLPLYRVDAFVLDRPFSGNPAAVVPLERWLDDDVMMGIAAENNLSETAFFIPGDGAMPLRWFTPTVEIDLCGHATLASAHVLFHHLGARGERLTFSSRSGELSVTRDGDRLTLDFPARPATPCAAPDELGDALGARPAGTLSASYLLVVFETEDEVRALAPDFAAIAELPQRAVIVTAPGREVDFVSRFFGPKVGVPEDPVTGSAHCTLTPYWARRLGKRDLEARQLSRRGGALWLGDRGERVLIAGRARTTLEGAIVGT